MRLPQLPADKKINAICHHVVSFSGLLEWLGNEAGHCAIALVSTLEMPWVKGKQVPWYVSHYHNRFENKFCGQSMIVFNSSY